MPQPKTAASKSIPAWLDDLFLGHPRETGESYGRHLWFTARTAGYLLLTAMCLVIHGLVPRFHETTASDMVFRLNEIMQARRRGVKVH